MPGVVTCFCINRQGASEQSWRRVRKFPNDEPGIYLITAMENVGQTLLQKDRIRVSGTLIIAIFSPPRKYLLKHLNSCTYNNYPIVNDDYLGIIRKKAK